MSDSIAAAAAGSSSSSSGSGKRSKPKAKAPSAGKRPASEEPAGAAASATKKMANGDGSASATASAVPDKYNASLLPTLQIRDWKLPNFELYGSLCAGGNKQQHELCITTPPGLVRSSNLHGLGEKGFQQTADTNSNKLTMELVYGDLPATILERHPELDGIHQFFITFMKDLVEGSKDVLLKHSQVRPEVYARIKADCKKEGLTGDELKAEARERYFHDLTVHINFFEKDGKPMMSLPLECKAMRANKDGSNPHLFKQPGPDVKEPLYTYLKLVGPYAEFMQNKPRYYNVQSERLYENEIEADPWFKALNRGDVAAVQMFVRGYSHDPQSNGDPDYWAIKPALDHTMVRLYHEKFETEKDEDKYKREVERVLDCFDNPPPEVDDEYAAGW